MRNQIKDDNDVVQELELELHQKTSDLDSAKCEIETLQTVKQSLKAKLKECKGKLEATVTNYESKAEEVNRMQQKISSMEEEFLKIDVESKKKKRYAIL